MVIMPHSGKIQSTSWLNTPIKSEIGTLSLAGNLQRNLGIDPLSMRILGKYALILMHSGKGYYADGNGIERELNVGDLILIFPEIPHAYGPLYDEDWQHSYVVFDGPQFDLFRNTGIINSNDPIWHLEPVDFWKRRFQEVFPPNPRVSKSTANRTIAQFSYLIADMSATHTEISQIPEDAWLDESMHLLSGPTGSIWLEPQTVAQRVGLSYENFRKQFVKRSGHSPAQFQKRRRIEHACAAIYQNSHSFKELAHELGFCDTFHFSKVFRQITGDTPSAFRKKAQGSPTE